MNRPVDAEFFVANLVCTMTEINTDIPTRMYCPIVILGGLFQIEVLSVYFAQGLIKFAFDCDCHLSVACGKLELFLQSNKLLI